jgi:5-formyltetrahydrofolate cyclo-ligase
LTKSQLRKQYLAKRQQLTEAEFEALNLQLLQQFQQLDLSGISCIHLFLPMRERMEPDTYLITKWLKADHPQIKIVYPKTNFANLTMQSFTDDEDLQVGISAHGITEPISGNEVAATEIDLIIVPLLAFDERGYRVGYGKGFYDRFLTQCRPDTQFIGLSFFDPVDRIDDIDQYDIKMDLCLMPFKKWEWPD